MSNHLENQTSPYLIQHVENPVDWYPWGEEAFEKARREDKPVFLSIGYSTCHWCHVMAHESFENEEIAGILNENFVSIKVDREERPDVDSVYMSVCQALTGSGGWPMSIFMTPEQKPFFAGTYFPPKSRYGRMGFGDLLHAIANKWKEGRRELLESAETILIHIRDGQGEGPQDIEIQGELPGEAVSMFLQSFDREYGGFGSAPKFPTPHNLLFLTLYAHIYKKEDVFSSVGVTLEQMRRGGIFDQIGYGFSRYSTDRYYLVPHFEKMLYDNGLLMMAYGAAYKMSGKEIFLQTAKQITEYVAREMTDQEGAFYSAQDADSEGEEGRFYVWDYEEIMGLLGEVRGKEFCEYYGITKQGNFEGKNIPNLLQGNAISSDFEKERITLYEYRKSRASLHLDDKILTSWNSLMIAAMAMLYRLTGEREYLKKAQQAQQFLEKNLIDGRRIYVSWRKGQRSVQGFLDEYAYVTMALLTLYEATSKTSYLERAKEICSEAVEQFEDRERGGYFLYGKENDRLIVRPKETYDGAIPSGNSVMAYSLVRLAQLAGEEEWEERARRQLAFLSNEAKGYPAAQSMFLLAQLFYENPPEKITAVLEHGVSKEEILARLPLYADVRLLERQTEEYRLKNNQTTYYICKEQTCFPPTNEEPF